jgi:hypothetical protein
MKRPERSQQIPQPAPIWKDMQFVQKDAPAIRVRQYVIEDDRGVRYAAELTAHEPGERAVIDAPSHEELGLLIEPAAKAFSLAVRLRKRCREATR